MAHTSPRHLLSSLAILTAAMVVAGCAIQRVPGARPDRTNQVPVDETPPDRPKDKPSVKDFLETCDRMAQALVMVRVVQESDRPVVVEIKPIQNKSGVPIDLTIYPQTIRAKIIEYGAPNIVFRDESARKDIVAERADQSDAPVVVERRTASARDVTQATEDGLGTMPPAGVTKADSEERTTHKKATVTSRIAPVDYYLKGFIYARTEKSAGVIDRGFRYYQFQFRLTDAKSGIVAWEKSFRVKRRGPIQGT